MEKSIEEKSPKTDTQETKKKVLGGNTSGNLLNLVF